MVDEEGDAVEGAKGGRLLLFVTFLAFASIAVGPIWLGWMMQDEGVDFGEFVKWRYLGATGVFYHLPAACCALLVCLRRGVAVSFGAVVMAFLAVNIVRGLVTSGWNIVSGGQLAWIVLGVVLLEKIRRRTRDGVII